MRIVIDMQGAQSASRFRGIGRYTMNFAQAVVRNRGEHEVILALSGLFPETIEPIRAAFDGLLPQENIRVWYAPGPVRECEPGNDSRREVAELLREAFLISLQPDVIHICSLFEGYVDDAVTSIGRFDTKTPVSVTLYDLIPLLNPDHYLRPNPVYESYYMRKIAHLKQASLYLAISEASRKEAISTLQISPNKVVNISAGVEEHFKPVTIEESQRQYLQEKYGINRPFVLFTGATDERKNLPRLIEAYAALPSDLRARHQLVCAGKVPQNHITHFKKYAADVGLKKDELVFTGYVSDEELVELYNFCVLFVFPSWHEGFGLPPLEAMACGAPVIGANTSSLPEVIGLEKALFDPFDVSSISQKMAQVLKDEEFRNKLRSHGFEQAKKFSWDKTAQLAIQAWERLPRYKFGANDYLQLSLARNRLINMLANKINEQDETSLLVLSHCIAQNESTGIERQLLLDVSELCQRDAATGVQRVVRSYLKWLLESPPTGFRVEPVYATREQGYRYARVFTQGFLGQEASVVTDDPVSWQRSDIFFGLDMQHHVQLIHANFYRQLKLEGVTVKFIVYDLLPIQLADLFKDGDIKSLHEQWLAMIAGLDGAVCISKSTADAYEAWIKDRGIPRASTFHISWVHIGADIDGSKPSTGMPADAKHVLKTLRQRPTFLCVSTIEPRKRQGQILDAVEQLWRQGVDINLLFVGQPGWKTEALAERLRSHPEQGQRLFWLAGISDEYLEKVYAASTCLIAASLNEGFGLPLIEAARHGIPVIARDIPVFREIAGEYAYYFCGDTAQELAEAIKMWLRLYNNGEHPHSNGMQWLTWQQSTELLKRELVAQNYLRRQLLVDISELVQRDVKSGIQRVVRSILKEWLTNPPDGYRVEPVYATVDQGYRYARRFTLQFLGCEQGGLDDDPIDYAPGDIFFALDLQPQVQVAQRNFYQHLRRHGVKVYFLVHDLLCVLMPQYFGPGASDGFSKWLEVVAESDGAIAVSETVARDLADWVKAHGPKRLIHFKIAWSHNGADIDNSHPTRGMPEDAASLLKRLSACPTFLMVGTIEPRKAHKQVLDAFEQLWWSSSVDVNLVFVGKQGWMVDDLVARLRSHPELNNRLFWLEGISDEYLEKVYAASTCLIAASYGEGFGLPLIEAAQHKLPIIARDIPVFREVAGEYAFYFPDEKTPEVIATAVKEWLALYEKQGHPKSDDMPWLTWKQSAKNLLEIILEGKWLYKIKPDASVKPGVVYDHKTHRLSWKKGWSGPEQNFRWTDGNEAIIEFFVSSSDVIRHARGIRLKFNTLGSQQISIALNDNILFDGVVEGIDQELRLRNAQFNADINRLVLYLPNARQPDNGDKRFLAIAIKEFEVMHDENK